MVEVYRYLERDYLALARAEMDIQCDSVYKQSLEWGVCRSNRRISQS